ncbi:MAG: pyridoxamine 5'-phosphate oxidase family protein [Anaerolineae bacterium]|jgi:uncharacterized pyridoxamine 5'-phosphate oxidase family protein
MTRDEVIAYIKEVKFGYLATVGADNAPRVRPVGIDTVYGDALYFFTFSTTRKVAEIQDNPQVEIVWAKIGENSQVRISGKLVVEKDEAVQQRFRADNPMVANLLPPEAQHLFLLYRLEPSKVEMAKGLVPYTEVVW